MNDHDLDKLTNAAIQLNRVTEMLSEDPEVPESMLALLAAASGCFTTLVHVAELLGEIHTSVLFPKLTIKEKEFMQ